MKGRFAGFVFLLCVSASCGHSDPWMSEAVGISISQFRSLADDDDSLYRISGEVVSVTDYSEGSYYLMDDSGFVLVYRMLDFSAVAPAAGDHITLMARRNVYLGSVEACDAVCCGCTKGVCPGWSGDSAPFRWMELPRTYPDDGCRLLVHGASGKDRNFSIYYDYGAGLPLWSAHVLCPSRKGSGSRTDAYAFDPLVPESCQQVLSRRSYSKGNSRKYVRGHLVPSADRLRMRDNLETFLSTNIIPQDPAMNSGAWSKMEQTIRSRWMAGCDSLYIVTGIIPGGDEYVLDNSGKKIPVPAFIYKALLAFSPRFGYKGAAFCFANGSADAETDLRSRAVSIDSLEEITGMDLFVNLPDALEDQVESVNPLEEAFWW